MLFVVISSKTGKSEERPGGEWSIKACETHTTPYTHTHTCTHTHTHIHTHGHRGKKIGYRLGISVLKNRKRGMRWYLEGGQSRKWRNSRRKKAVYRENASNCLGSETGAAWEVWTSGLWTRSICWPYRGGNERALLR